jgi:hypothetical protein
MPLTMRKWLPLAMHLLFVICLLIAVYAMVIAALYMYLGHQLQLPFRLPWPLIPLADLGVLLLAPAVHKQQVAAATRVLIEPESEA